ncbi:hypothetical protein [Escherichia phage KW1E_UTAR]|jgi:hypothetical protein|nr:hypothetical protein [Escherichia phage KW1E_UTAR]DAZ70785.1 MAG TPA: hypothetical protein [Caudoviricetes sp.]
MERNERLAREAVIMLEKEAMNLLTNFRQAIPKLGAQGGDQGDSDWADVKLCEMAMNRIVRDLRYIIQRNNWLIKGE